MNSRLLMAMGLLLFGVAALWQWGLSSRWTQRIPPGWQWESTFIGSGTEADPATGEFPDQDAISIYEREIQASPGNQKAGAIVLEDRYTLWDPASDKVIYGYIYQAPVDPETGLHLSQEYSGEYFVFPRRVEKKSYTLRYSYLKGIPVSFQREEEVEGIKTYLFAYKGRGEYTESYAGSEQYAGIQVEPGQEIKCADDQFVYKAWVEPLTGEILKVEENCYSGDYIYDIATGQALSPVLRWSAVTAGDDLIRRAEIIRHARTRYLWADRYLPLGLLLLGLMAFGFGVTSRTFLGDNHGKSE